MLDHPRLSAPLCSLERRTARSGRDSIDHAPGGHDDLSNAVAGLVVGLDLDPLLRKAGLTQGQIEDEGVRIGAKEQIAFVQAVADALHDDRLGFRLAQSFELREIGLIYYVAASSETLVEAMRRIERYSGTANEAVVFRCRSASELAVELHYSGVARHSDRHQMEFFLTTLVRTCRALTGTG